MVQVSGLLFLLFVSVGFILVSFLLGVALIKIRDYRLYVGFQKAFVTPALWEKVDNLNEAKMINWSYDARRIGEKVLRRRY